MSAYLTAASKLPPYLPFPRFLLETGLNQTAMLLYAVLLDRANLSRVRGWTDEDGHIFIVYPVNKLADVVDKGPSTVKKALAELETAELIERRRCGNGIPNRIYVKQPDSQETDRQTDQKPADGQPENRTPDSQETGPQTAGKPDSHIIRSSNLKSNLRGVNARARGFGRYGNVFLTEEEAGELRADFPNLWREYIERLSAYMVSTGKSYQNHPATIRRWAGEDRVRTGGGLSDYSCQEEESL